MIKYLLGGRQNDLRGLFLQTNFLIGSILKVFLGRVFFFSILSGRLASKAGGFLYARK